MGPRRSVAAVSAIEIEAYPSSTPRAKKRLIQDVTPVTASSSRRRKRARRSPSSAADEANIEAVGTVTADDGHINGDPHPQGDDQVGGAIISVQHDGEGPQDAEKEMEAWLDFAQDHYEMIEQLPLELHRNFRLLKGLDDECIAQTEKLQKLIRQYIADRQTLALQLARARAEAEGDKTQDAEAEEGRRAEAKPETDEAAPPEEEITETIPAETGHDKNMEEVNNTAPPTGNLADSNVGGDLGVPVPDGQGGLVVPALDTSAPANEHPKPFPSTLPEHATVGRDTAEGQDKASGAASEKNNAEGASALHPRKTSPPPPRPHLTLPEIGRLVREIVRNGEEKLAVAIGAYNSIDRHIRALDSAMPIQQAEAEGARPGTIPGTYVQANHAAEGGQNGGTAAGAGGDDDEINIGIGGGAAGAGGANANRKSRKKGRKGGKPTQTAVLVAQEKGEEEQMPPDPLLSADPNEPRYCICNQVSYGQMIGCDNDDCPIEWFHLGCLDLVKPPEGKWLCPVCRPQPAVGSAAMSKTGSGNGGAHATGKHSASRGSTSKTKKAVPKGAHNRRR